MASESQKLPRPPIVVVMGHVDHGKTTLLDYIRKTNVAGREAGGITQSIGAYEIVHNGKKITFVDTPGHEAFSKMRARGARAADLAILVVAADEGVKPQTQESIKILEESETPFVVAITKTDKTGANVEKAKNDLTAAGVLLEGYGGRVSFEPVSATTGEHVGDLLDLVLLATEVEHLTYDPAAPARGFVLESKIDRRRGLEATLILKDGTLRRNDPIRTPTAYGRIKILENFAGEAAAELEPSAPALVIGFEDLPETGEEFISGEAASVELAAPTDQRPLKKAAAPLPAQAGLPAVKESEEALNLILKAVDTGSLEAVSEIVRALPSEKPIKVVDESVGDVTDNDVKLAIPARATIIAFKSRTEKGAKTLAEANSARIIASDIIYDLVKAVQDLIAGKEEAAPLGTLEILAVFNQKKQDKQLVGGKVTAGTVKNKAAFDIERGGQVIGTGRITSLQQQKKDAPQVGEGNEAGLLVNASAPIQVGDALAFRAQKNKG